LPALPSEPEVEFHGPAPFAAIGFPVFVPGAIYSEFRDVIEPIDHGTAIIRLNHADALERLREFNAEVVDAGISGNFSVESLVIAARLSVARDYALVAIQTTYATVSEALQDLDFIMAIYDEEEAAATRRCDDTLVTAIRAARAAAAQAMLAANIRLPGIVESSVDGIWPSLLAAHKLYGDGKRYEQVELYNPTMPPFFIGREATAPAR
jgi:prophage DNA circulation protein